MARHYLYFFSERRVYCIFPTFLEVTKETTSQVFLQIYHKINEGIEIGLQSVWKFLQSNPPSHYMREMLRLIIKESSFQFN